MKIEKIINRDFTQKEKENIDYFIRYFGKMNVAFVGEHCAVVLSTSDKTKMEDNCLEIINEIKNGKQIITSHILEDGRGMLIMGYAKFFIQTISENELSENEIKQDKMNAEHIELLKNYCLKALEKPEIIALGLRHEFINFMEDHYVPLK